MAQLSELLFIGHIVASKVWIPELALTRQESIDLGTASANVLRHYEWGGLAEKTKDWLVLCGCAYMTYGPKFGAARKRVKEAREARLHPKGMTQEGGVKMAERPPEEVQAPSPQFAPDGAADGEVVEH